MMKNRWNNDEYQIWKLNFPSAANFWVREISFIIWINPIEHYNASDWAFSILNGWHEITVLPSPFSLKYGLWKSWWMSSEPSFQFISSHFTLHCTTNQIKAHLKQFLLYNSKSKFKLYFKIQNFYKIENLNTGHDIWQNHSETSRNFLHKIQFLTWILSDQWSVNETKFNIKILFRKFKKSHQRWKKCQTFSWE